MTRKSLIVLAVLGLAASATFSDAEAKPRYAPDQLIVSYSSNASKGERTDFREKYSLTRKERLLPSVELVRVKGQRSLKPILRKTRQDKRTVRVERNSYYYLSATGANDPQYENDNQWSLRNTGKPYYLSGDPYLPGQQPTFAESIAGADISADLAWDITTGSKDVVVAVIDGGIAYDHPDLKGNIWQNLGEVGGGLETNGIDDDGNGYIDDVNGWDFGAGDNDPFDYTGKSYGFPSEDGTLNHGTRIASIIGASGNNANRMAGINWNVRIMPIRALNAEEFAPIAFESDILKSIKYAAENGAHVVSISFNTPDPEYSGAMSQLISSYPGILFVVAAGNHGKNIDNSGVVYSPCGIDAANLICTAATTSADELADFSNFGSGSVDIAAPGEEITTVAPEPDSSPSLVFRAIGGALYNGKIGEQGYVNDVTDDWADTWSSVITTGGINNGWGPDKCCWLGGLLGPVASAPLADSPTFDLGGGFTAGADDFTSYKPNTDSWARLDYLNLSDKKDCQIQIGAQWGLADDKVLVEASEDGQPNSNWQVIGKFDGSTPGKSQSGGKWAPDLETLPVTTEVAGIFFSIPTKLGFQKSFNLSQFDGKPKLYIRFRLVSNESNQADGIYIYSIAVGCGNYEPIIYSNDQESGEIAASSGTSFAAPMVAGVAALMLSIDPNLSGAQLSQKLTSSVDKLGALKGKVASGGRLNAYKAVTSVDIPKYKYVDSWGNKGPNKLQAPTGLEWVSAQGHPTLYVTEASANRVRAYSGFSDFVPSTSETWGSFGSGPGQFSRPYDISADGAGWLYVSDWKNNRVQRFDLDGNYLSETKQYSTHPLKYPIGVGGGTAGQVWVANTGNKNAQFYRSPEATSKLAFAGELFCVPKIPNDHRWGCSSKNTPIDIAYDLQSNSVYVLEYISGRVSKLKYTQSGPQYMFSWGGNGSGPGKFKDPTRITTDGSGRVIVADSGNNRVQVFSAAGLLLTSFGSEGSGDGQLNWPRGVTTDDRGNIYVADSKNGRIVVFELSGSSKPSKLN